MTDDANRSPRPQPGHQQWSGREADGSQAWGTPTFSHDPHHTEWTYEQAQYSGQYTGAPYYGPPAPQWSAPPPSTPPQGSGVRRRPVYVAVAAAIVAAALTAFGFVALGNTAATVTGSGTSQPSISGGTGGSGNSGGSGSAGGSSGSGGSGSGSTGNGTTSVSIATAKQQQGVVTIVSVLKYQNAESAGTGMILSSDGEILTNNHVIDGATSITVTVETTGRSYRADVVGTDAADDVAVLKLQNASGLTKANIGDSSDVAKGDTVVGVGNAGGTGTLRASKGSVLALNQTITATNDSGQNGERLHGLIEVNAPIISGDSGGPMYDAAGEIIGMNTAASVTSSRNGGNTGSIGLPQGSATASQAYAIPIDSAVAIADKIESGVTTSTIKQGVPGFLGVSVSTTGAASSSGGASIASVLQGGPAATAGITGGSVITSVNGTRVSSGDGLKSVMSGVKPGSTVRITWTDSSGASHSANVTPIKGPAA